MSQLTNTSTTTDHDLLIQILANQQNQGEKIESINEHVTVMNTEQGVQAIAISNLQVRMNGINYITGAIAIAIIGAIVTTIWKKIVTK